MTIADLLPYLNLLLPGIAGLVFSIERRLTRLEALREADTEARRVGVRARV